MNQKTPRLRSSPATRLLLIGMACALTLVATAAWADAMTPTNAFALTGQGGVAFQVPGWKESRPTKEDVAVFEHDTRAKGSDDFYLLMLTVEAGPTGKGTIDWDAIRKNIVDEAAKGSAVVTLAFKGDFKDAAGFAGQRMAGTMKSKDQTMAVELVALVQNGKLVTVSVVSGKAAVPGQKLAADVAKSAKLK